MSRICRALAATASVLLVVSSTAVLIAGRDVAKAEGPAAPVFTIEQATAGKAAYAKSCSSCHLPDLSGNAEIPALAGKPFKEAWGARTTKELLDYMSAAMPYGGPSLPADTYLSILAYVLQSNGAAAGAQPLNASTTVRIESLMTAPTTTAIP
jgi:mono/diheme cytochrome c family protein